MYNIGVTVNPYPRMKDKKNNTYVADSGIHGKGLFAKRYIPKDTLLGMIETKPAKRDGPYVIWSDDLTECAEVICDFKYINHSNDPNVAYFDDDTVMTLKDVQPHSELTHNYGTEDAFELVDTD